MSKKYFAKYLPIEEEIKEQDIILYKNSILKVDEFTHDNTVVVFNLDGSESEHNEINENVFKELAIKVKLFLCIKEIKKGDEFKVVGEISENAIWVKEGYEFDEKDIKKGYLDGEQSFWLPENWYKNLVINDPKKAKTFSEIILIECPCCNTFK